jgi:hypothetical protein
MSCITITFGDQAENHKGMQIIGNAADKGFDVNDLVLAKQRFESKGLVCQLIDLKTLLDDNTRDKADEAVVLVVTNVVDLLLKKSKSNKTKLFEELEGLEWDSKALMYGRVVNKHARHNLCFDFSAQEPNYDAGLGRIVSWNTVPLLKKIKTELPKYIDGADNLAGEGNYYYDVNKCGISNHGDSERLKVIGIRIGSSMPLHFQWYLNSKPVGTNLKINLNSGDLYVMSEKTVGTDWKTKSIYTLRHAAGCPKYTNV